MSQGISCKVAAHKPAWFVTQRNSRCSAFDGYREMSSAYSCVRCPICGAAWRTKSKFVDSLPNAPKDWHAIPLGTAAMPDLLPKRGVVVTSALVEKLNEESE